MSLTAHPDMKHTDCGPKIESRQRLINFQGSRQIIVLQKNEDHRAASLFHGCAFCYNLRIMIGFGSYDEVTF
jgi:hypothetical protein